MGGPVARRPRFRAIAGVAAAVLAAGACRGSEDPPPPAEREVAPDAATASVPTAAGDEWTAGILERPAAGAPVATLTSVRSARHDGFDRVVWEFSAGLPGVHLEYVDEPVRGCGSGEPVPLGGDGWLEVRLEPARAHTEEGRPTVPDRRRALDLPTVEEIALTCDFEAVVTWVLANRSPEPFRLAALEDPPRIVVDVRHSR